MPIDRPDQLPYVWCNHDDSNHTMWLPHSSLLGRFPDRPEMTNNTYFEIYACPTCGLVCEYRPLNVHWHPRQNVDPNNTPEPYVAEVEFPCDAENCGIPVIIRKPTQERLTSAAIVEQSASWVLKGIHCGKGHVILGLPAKPQARIVGSDPGRSSLD